MSDALSQSKSQSQTPGGSTTSCCQQHSTDNVRRIKPTTLSYYQSTEVHAPLAEAKESFAATAFASGFFFYHLRSPYIEIFQTYAWDAIAQAADKYNSKCFNIYWYYWYYYYYYHCANYYIQLKYSWTKTSWPWYVSIVSIVIFSKTRSWS